MLTEDKITEIFVMADDFCKVFNETLRRRCLMKVNPGRKRNYHRPNRMSDAVEYGRVQLISEEP